MRIAQIQLSVFKEKEKNLEELEYYLGKVDSQKPDLVTAGEMFDCPYLTQNFPLYAEPDQGDTWKRLSAMAASHHVYLSAGSVPEKDSEGHIFNTAYVFNRDGAQIAKHRKVHLFDISIRGGQSYRESDTLTAGSDYTVFDTEYCRMGILICFDLRFPELSRKLVEQGAKVILVPGAFNMTTGPAHWELSFRMRALDNQCYMIGTSDARDESSGYVSWGHSILTSPWGNVISQMDEKEGFTVQDIDLTYVDKIRRELPLLSARRPDVYNK